MTVDEQLRLEAARLAVQAMDKSAITSAREFDSLFDAIHAKLKGSLENA